jgi:hypothetical protein
MCNVYSSVTNWNSGEPNNAGNEDCVETIMPEYVWNDLACNAEKFFICKKCNFPNCILALLFLNLSYPIFTILKKVELIISFLK